MFVLNKSIKRKTQHTCIGGERTGPNNVILQPCRRKEGTKREFLRRAPPSGHEWLYFHVKSNQGGIQSKNQPDKEG